MAEKATCARCTAPNAPGGKYCREHRNEYMREWRRTHPPTPEQVLRGRTRSYTNVLIRRGQLVPEPCRDCGSADVQAHHPDYSKPRLVVWLCPEDHRAEHRALRDLGLVAHETSEAA